MTKTKLKVYPPDSYPIGSMDTEPVYKELIVDKCVENPKKRQYIYLAGNISEDNRTYEWREKFTELMESIPNVVVVNPCANKFNQAMKNTTSGGLDFVKEAKKDFIIWKDD